MKSSRFSQWLAICLLVVLSACGSGEPSQQLAPLGQDAIILAFGDSLTYGTGANHQTESYPAVLAQLSGKTVINAGVPGEVSGEGLSRLKSLLNEHQPELVLLCHGGNDLLRKLDTDVLKDNLRQMIHLIREQGAQVVMLSVPKPGVFLKAAPLYQELASTQQVLLDNETITDIESQSSLKSDPIHPNAEGYRQLAEKLHQLLDRVGAF
ncbi:arylesterase [uncultured Methylophaga sp.]|uniref:arylesterase n=1 Tax=uncultured Methylophaga sp. TaxID=285271 RepID=UPI002612A1A5|nr:arylesterase [uncultured Methylophaga sp.]